MAWDDGQTLSDRWGHICDLMRRARPHWNIGRSYAGFADALLRESPRLSAALKQKFRQVMQHDLADQWQREGWVAFAVDGTRLETPHTTANAEGLSRAGREKTGPQVYLTTLYHLGTGLPWDYRLGPGTDSERTHLQEMVAELPVRSLLVADAGFAGYPLFQRLLREGHSFLIRVGANQTLLTELGYCCQEQDGLVSVWPETAMRNAQHPLLLRLIRLPGKKHEVCLLTNILNAEELTDQQAKRFYQLRWGEEVFFRSCKQTLQRARLKSRTPATCRAEAEWTLLGVWLMGLMSVRRITAGGGDPLQWSVAASRTALRHGIRSTADHLSRDCSSLAHALAHALKDTYQRLCRKSSRNYPRKKYDKPPSVPHIKSASKKQRQRAKQLQPHNIPTTWTA